MRDHATIYTESQMSMSTYEYTYSSCTRNPIQYSSISQLCMDKDLLTIPSLPQMHKKKRRRWFSISIHFMCANQNIPEPSHRRTLPSVAVPNMSAVKKNGQNPSLNAQQAISRLQHWPPGRFLASGCFLVENCGSDAFGRSDIHMATIQFWLL